MRARFEATAFCKGFVRGNGFPNNGVDMANPLIKNTGGLKKGYEIPKARCAQPLGGVPWKAVLVEKPVCRPRHAARIPYSHKRHEPIVKTTTKVPAPFVVVREYDVSDIYVF